MAQLFWTGNANNNLWGDANNWNPTQIPLAIDDVVIGGPFTTVRLESPDTFSQSVELGNTGIALGILGDRTLTDTVINLTSANTRFGTGGNFIDSTLTFGLSTQINLNHANTRITSRILQLIGNDTIVNQGIIRADGSNGGTQLIDPINFSNQGTINAVNGAFLQIGANGRNVNNAAPGQIAATDAGLRLEGNWANGGTIRLTDAHLELAGTYTTGDIGTITRAGTTEIFLEGQQDNTGTTLTLNTSTGSYILNGGTILGGTVIQNPGTVLEIGNGASFSTLDDITVEGDLTIDQMGARLLLRNDVNFTGDINLLGTGVALGFFGDGTATDTTTLDNTTITLDGAQSSLGVSNDLTLVLGNNAQVNLNHSNNALTLNNVLVQGGGAILNQGTVIADGSMGISLRRINPTRFTNEGILEARNGADLQVGSSGRVFTNLSADTLTDGTYRVFDTSQLRLNGANIVNNAATILLDGANSSILSNLINNNSNALANFANNMASGNFTIQNDRDFSTIGALTNAGQLRIGSGSTLLVAGDYAQMNGQLTLANGTLAVTGGVIDLQAGEYSGSGTFNGNVDDAATFSANQQADQVNIVGNYDRTANSILNVELGGTDAGEFDQFNVTGNADLDGTLNVSFINDFETQVTPGDRFTIATATQLTNSGLTLNLPSLPGGLVLQPLFENNTLVLEVQGTAQIVDVLADTPQQLEGDAGVTAYTFRVNRSGDLTRDLTLTYAVTGSGGNPANGDDFGGTLPNGTLTFSGPQQTEQTVTVNVIGDMTVEADEAFTFTLSDPSGTALLRTPTAISTIQNDDSANVELAIAPIQATQLEGNAGTTPFTFQVTRSGAVDNITSTVDFLLSGQGANPADASDFGGSFPSGTVTFAAGQQSQTVTVEVSADSIPEPDETFGVELLNPSNGASITTAIAIGQIRNDDTPVISISDYRASEGNGNPNEFQFNVTLSERPTTPVTVDVSTADGTATVSGNDYIPIQTQTLTFLPEGPTQQSVTVEVTPDSMIEPSETFTINLSNPVGATIFDGEGIGTIVNDDSTVELQESTVIQVEGDSGLTQFLFTFIREGAQIGARTVEYEIIGSGVNPATANDFLGGMFPSGTVTLREQETRLAINVQGDTEMEPDETFSLVLSNPSDGLTLLNSTAMGTIQNDEVSPAFLELAARDADREETDNGTVFDFTVTRSGNLNIESTVEYVITGAGTSPTNALDFRPPLTGQLTFPVGEANRAIVVRVAGDTVIEPDETFSVTLLNPSANTQILTDTAMGTIRDDDQTRLNIIADNGPIVEGIEPAEFRIVRSGNLDLETTVSVSVRGGGDNPVNAADFPGNQFPKRQITFAPGEDSFLYRFLSANDTDSEPNETYEVVLSGAINGVIETAIAPGNIFDDDTVNPGYRIRRQRFPIEFEGDDGEQVYGYRISRSGDVLNLSVVSVEVVGTGQNPANTNDFGTPTTVLVGFLPGEREQTFQLSVQGDRQVEADETFNVTLVSTTDGLPILLSSVSETIRNDDQALSIAPDTADQVEGNSGTTPYTFIVNRTGFTGGETNVEYTVQGTGNSAANADDFGGIFPSGTLTFAPGENRQTLTLEVMADPFFERDESFEVVLSSPIGNATLGVERAQGTIRNDDVDMGDAIAVTEATDDGTGNTSGTISWAIQQANDRPGLDTLQLETDVRLNFANTRFRMDPLIESDITIEGNGFTISGDNNNNGQIDAGTSDLNGDGVINERDADRPVFFVRSGNVNVQNLTIRGAVARGRDGSGGGAGMGGGLFVYDGNVTLENVTFDQNRAFGGTGQDREDLPGGGVGLNGINGTDSQRSFGKSAGGGAGGSGGPGGFGGGGGFGGMGGSSGFTNAVDSGSKVANGGAGGPGEFGGRGGAGSDGEHRAGQGKSAGNGGSGGSGGFGGGGGSGGEGGNLFRGDGAPPSTQRVGRGGFGGLGGFGGGGGLPGPAGVESLFFFGNTADDFSNSPPSQGGFGAGDGVAIDGAVRASGGGGAGLGGAVFIRSGTLSVNNSSFTHNQATGGRGQYADRSIEDGRGFGGAIFAVTEESIRRNNGNDHDLPIHTPTVTINNTQFDQNTTQNPEGQAIANDIFGTPDQDASSNGLTSNLPRSIRQTGRGQDGAIASGLVFLDANQNSQLDDNEPVTLTDSQGNFDLGIPATFDPNGNGQLDSTEGQLVLQGGIDIATGLPLLTPLKALPNSQVISPLTTLQVTLVDSGQTPDAAQSDILSAFNLPAIDLLTFDPIAATETHDSSGATVLATQVAIQTLLTQSINIFQGAVEMPVEMLAATVTSVLASQIQAGNTINLSDRNSIRTLLNDVVDKLEAQDPNLDLQIVQNNATQLSEIISASNAEILAASTQPTGQQSLSAIAQAQQVGQGKVAQDLRAAMSGDQSLERVLAENTGETLRQQIRVTILSSNPTNLPNDGILYQNLHLDDILGTPLTEAQQTFVKAAFSLPQALDLETFNPVTAALEGDPLGGEILAQLVAVQTLIVQVGAALQGVLPGQPRSALETMTAITLLEFLQAQATDGKTVTLSDASQLQTLLENLSHALQTLDPTLDLQSFDTNRDAIVDIIGASLAQVLAVTAAETPQEALLALFKDRTLFQHEIATDLKESLSGVRPINEVQAENTGTSLIQQLESLDNTVAPFAQADAYITSAYQDLSISALEGLLANDVDINGDILTASLASGPSNGTLSLETDGAFIYQPNFGFIGIDSFTYTAFDGQEFSTPATVEIQVLAFPDPPTDGIEGTSQRDHLKGTKRSDYIRGLDGGDRIYGGNGHDTIDGGESRDVLLGNKGHDLMDGGAGNDYLKGNSGNDTLLGNRGRDWLKGHNGNDLLLGGDGNDFLKGNAGNDTLYGGRGRDILRGDRGQDTYVLSIDEGVDQFENFKLGQDLIAFTHDLTFGSLEFEAYGSSTAILFAGQTLAVVTRINLSDLAQSDNFTTIS